MMGLAPETRYPPRRAMALPAKTGAGLSRICRQRREHVAHQEIAVKELCRVIGREVAALETAGIGAAHPGQHAAIPVGDGPPHGSHAALAARTLKGACVRSSD